MSGFIKQILFGDYGNWWHTRDVHNHSIKQRDAIRKTIYKNTSIDEDQEERIIQLELICGTLLAILREKDLINESDITDLIEFAEKEAKSSVLAKKRIMNSGFNRI